MKMMKYMTCLATALLALVACSDADDILSAYHSDPNAVHITAEVGKASADGFTRSNPLGDAEAQKKFNTDDEISVKADGQAAVTYKFNGTEWIPQDSKFLKWESETMNFTAYYPATYTGGTPTQPMEYNSEANLAAADYMSFSDSQKNTGDNKLTLNMNRQMARVVVEVVGFNDQYAGATVNSINSLTIMGVKAYKHSDNKFYALMVPCEAKSTENFLSLKVGEGNTETLTGIPALEAGKSYTYDLTVGKNKVVVTGITVKDWTTDKIINGVAELDTRPYVTFKAEGTQNFKMTTEGSYTISGLEYSVNGGEWMTVEKDKEVTFGGTNGNLQLRGTNTEGTAADNYNYSHIKLTYADVHVACTGDIRTLLDYRNYKTVDTKNARFCNLFENCTALTFAPKLPAETLASNCYSEMFSGCTNLNTAPELPATTLAEACYSEMFSGCTNLNTAPSLPATKLVENCYYNMFSGCTNLNTAPKLPATKLAYWCYYGMFNDCSSLTEAPILPAETLANGCYFYMFSGCKNLKTAPSLPATRLARYCYHSMFRGCTNLTSVTMLAPRDQITSKERCCDDWLNNAGTSAASRTLKVTDVDAYDALVSKGYLPADYWQKGKCSVSW
uniref:fimbrillin family protein n=1 Tax=Prevotella sp. TaxID=59823 RepID=UPI003FED5B19